MLHKITSINYSSTFGPNIKVGMKSITEQGSSLEKAIKSAWERAQKPKEFLVKIFEEPTYNFLGINTHPAKIGLFFDLEHPTDSYKSLSQKNTQQHVEEVLPQEVKQHDKVEQPQKAVIVDKEIWSQEMIQFSETWLKGVLKHVDMADQSFSISALHYDLRIVFRQPLFTQSERQQQLFRSLCLLLLQTLRQKFRRPLRGFRIIINSHDQSE